jgi:hypothetical protein
MSQRYLFHIRVLGYDSSLLQHYRLFLRSRYGEDMQRSGHATREQRRLPAVYRKSNFTPMQPPNGAACRLPRCLCCRQSNESTNLAQAGSPRLSISIESLLIKRPSCRTTQLAQQFWAGLDSAAIKAHVARYCGDVSSMQAREGRMLHIRHLRNRRRPKCRIEARKTPRLITHEEVTGGKMQGLAHACGCSYL